jgi:hypothetical protein
VALYAGPFISFLEELNQSESWRELYGKQSPRLRDQELVLRVLGLFWNAPNYKRPLKKFLNDVVAEHRSESSNQHEGVKRLFEGATGALQRAAGRDAFRLGGTQVTSALAEVVMVSLMECLRKGGPIPADSSISEAIERLKSDSSAREAITRATADESQVETRLRKARDVLGGA